MAPQAVEIAQNGLGRIRRPAIVGNETRGELRVKDRRADF
jgi:hypothetical protein